jgi:serine/threonine protein phosphatase PrpC
MQEQTGMPTSHIRTIAVKLTHLGQVRDHNEDSVAIEIPENEALQAKGSLNLVADGMGGHQAGEVASQRAAEVIFKEYYDDPSTDVAASLSRALRRANTAVYEMGQSDLQRAGMGTTAVAAVVRGSEVHIASVGDSRAYVLRKGELIQITKDHSFVQEQIDANILTPEAARVHPKRNVITRALGHKPQVDVDTFEGKLATGDLLLLCSDGLSGILNDNEMLAILSQYPPQEAIMHLINEANLRGGPDNISALLVQALSYDPALPAALEVAPGVQPTTAVVARQPPGAAARPKRGRGRFFVVGLTVILLLAVLMAGSFLIFGGKDGQHPTSTLVPTLTQATTAMPALEPTSTPVGTPGETSTTSMPVGTPGESSAVPTSTAPESMLPTSTSIPPPTSTPTVPSASCQPAPPDALLAPPPGATFPVGSSETFQWEGGQLCENQVWQVTINLQPKFCPSTTEHQVICNLTDAGEFGWRVEIWTTDGQQVPAMASSTSTIVISASTPQP